MVSAVFNLPPYSQQGDSEALLRKIDRDWQLTETSGSFSFFCYRRRTPPPLCAAISSVNGHIWGGRVNHRVPSSLRVRTSPPFPICFNVYWRNEHPPLGCLLFCEKKNMTAANQIIAPPPSLREAKQTTCMRNFFEMHPTVFVLQKQTVYQSTKTKKKMCK